jgi:mannonate dehydratase
MGASTHNWGVQEYMGYPEKVHEAFPHAWSYADGVLQPGDAPGLGVDLDEALLSSEPYTTAYLPTARRLDGSVLDW